jgi:3,4-dihydroxy-2-butanone 4-phosphate synthase
MMNKPLLSNFSEFHESVEKALKRLQHNNWDLLVYDEKHENEENLIFSAVSDDCKIKVLLSKLCFSTLCKRKGNF